MLTDTFMRLPLANIRVNREERQRSAVSIDGLVDSIRRNGVLNPIIVTKDMLLVCGERRYQASLEAGMPDIPARFYEDLDPIETQIIELEENLKRLDLNWRDQTRAVGRIHELYTLRDPSWSQTQTCEMLALSGAAVSTYLRVYREIDSPRLAHATGLIAAYNLLARLDERRATDAMSDVMETSRGIFDAPPPPAGHRASTGQTPSQPPLPPIPILQSDFARWAPIYSGPPFNLLHCDFPYGINAFAGKQARPADGINPYDDSPEVFWQLCGVLCTNLDRLMAHSSHLVFWFSMKYYRETLDFFKKHAPSLHFNPMPLIWVKSDNTGIIPDPRRGPRQVYETALFASREDRPVVKVVANAYSAPTDKTYHPSTKPEPMLRHFFQMFVDGTTRLLDPTCGGGSALRAAESLGAGQVLGLELNEEHFTAASSAHRKFRALRRSAAA